mgnify:FL=1
MKQVKGFSLCLVVSMLVAALSNIAIGKDVSNTLFTIVGIMFSIGMSLAVTSNTSVVVNKSVRKSIREEIDRIRDLFISCFAVVACIYVLNIIFENWTLNVYGYKIFNLSIFQLIIQLYSIAYFVVNFKSLQNLNNQIGDAIND